MRFFIVLIVFSFFLLMFCAATTNKATTFKLLWFMMIISKSYFSFVNNFFTVSLFMLIVLTLFFANTTNLNSNCKTNKNVDCWIVLNWTKIDAEKKIILLNFSKIITQSRWLRSIYIRIWNVFSRKQNLNIFFFHKYEFDCWTCHFENSNIDVWTHDFFDNNKGICSTKIDHTHVEMKIVDWILNSKTDYFYKNQIDFFVDQQIESTDKKWFRSYNSVNC